MTNDDTKIKVTFSPGFFQNFEGTQEDLDAIVKEIQDAAEAGTLESKMLSEEDIDELPEEILAELTRVMNAITEDGIDLAALEADYKKRLN
jgi:nitrogen regulatory protein PII-like uncharacterized protein